MPGWVVALWPNKPVVVGAWVEAVCPNRLPVDGVAPNPKVDPLLGWPKADVVVPAPNKLPEVPAADPGALPPNKEVLAAGWPKP